MNYTKNLEQYKTRLKSTLNKERYEHSLGTAECARELAKKFGLDEQKAYFTGLIHDCAKCIPQNELKKYIENSPDLCDGELSNPKTYHAPAGEIFARKEFGVNDPEILSAVRWHTLGKQNMTDFEKIIFIADKIESRTRLAEFRTPILKVLEEENGLDKALLICYGNTIKSLVDRNLKICTQTIDLYNKLCDETA